MTSQTTPAARFVQDGRDAGYQKTRSYISTLFYFVKERCFSPRREAASLVRRLQRPNRPSSG
jgi:hypothetical protein